MDQENNFRSIARSAFMMGAELARRDTEGDLDMGDLFEEYWQGVMAVAEAMRGKEEESD